MAKAREVVKIEGMDELLKELEKMGAEAEVVMVEAALAGARVIAGIANVRAPGPHVEVEVLSRANNRAEVGIGPDRKHWYYLFSELGASPHPITTTRRQALRFFGDEGDAFAPQVAHPGMPAKPFLRPAMDENKDQAVAEVGDTFKRSFPARPG